MKCSICELNTVTFKCVVCRALLCDKCTKAHIELWNLSRKDLYLVEPIKT